MSSKIEKELKKLKAIPEYQKAMKDAEDNLVVFGESMIKTDGDKITSIHPQSDEFFIAVDKALNEGKNLIYGHKRKP